MKTDDLIDLLVKDEMPAKPRPAAPRALFAAAIGLAIAGFLVVSVLKLRHDFGDAIMMVMMKAGFAAAFAAIALPLMLTLLRPGRRLGRLAFALAAAFVVAALAAMIALAGTDPSERMRVWMGGGLPWCVIVVPILAAPTTAALLWIARRFAPTRLTLTGGAIGAFSGGIGAMAYAMYCPIDSVAFVATWYALAIAVCAALGALAGARFLRW
jgi:hypothetical protein